MKAQVYRNSWPIRGSFTISRGSKTQADTVVVELESEGFVGRGECVPYARYGESVESVEAVLTELIPKLESGMSRDALQKVLPSAAVRNAIDCAMWDLECKLKGCSVWQLLDITPEPVETAFTISIDSPKAMEKAASQNAFRPLLKIKLGGEDDIERLKAVRKGAPESKIIIDANEAWTPELYQQILPELIELDIAMIEQPFPANDDEALSLLPRPIPICADESCHDRETLSKIVGRYDMINIKIDKTGGLTEGLLLKEQAEQSGLKVMVGCMLSSSLSMAPAFVLAQGADIVDLDGPLLLSEDIEDGFVFTDNEMLPFTSKLWG
ncbi:N-acetyl-D-Glu racemase DgcA [Vibrio astriarenae]